MSGIPRPTLRITRRCLVDDLGLAAEVDVPPEDLVDRDGLIAAFVAQRSQNPQGQETVRGLASRIVAWTLHAGEHRGMTWHDEDAGIVWLLAGRFHRSGKPDDAYPYFLQLDRDDVLLPTAADYLAYEHAQALTLAHAIRDEMPVLRARARELPGTVCTGVLGGRIRLRLLYEETRFSVAISQRIEPGEMPLPKNWTELLLAGVFPGNQADEVSFSPCLGGEAWVPDEIVYFVERPVV